MFELATPWALVGIFLPMMIWFFWPRAEHQAQQALKVPFFDRLSTISEKHTLSTLPPIWLMLAWLLLVFALAGPRWVGEPEPQNHEGHNIFLALDISGSMAINDMIWQGQRYPRLTVVKHAAETFVEHRSGDKMGLILFGTRAYLQTPLTYDRQNVLLRLQDASVGLAGQATSLGDAIGLAVKHLNYAEKQGRVIILLTDGMNNAGVLSPVKAAELAQQESIKIYTIGLGSNQNGIGNLFLPMMGQGGELDEEALKNIAKITGGRYFRATDPASLQRIYALINQIETVQQEKTQIRPLYEAYPWPLAFAFFILCGGLLHETGIFKTLRTTLPIRKRGSL